MAHGGGPAHGGGLMRAAERGGVTHARSPVRWGNSLSGLQTWRRREKGSPKAG
uniref:Uncharacterized protein n=1 Tax=Arundo donax TaxID=35708 RepID=A0A0A9CII5_ARUDO